jgi:hypothetical protein
MILYITKIYKNTNPELAASDFLLWALVLITADCYISI